MLKGRPNTLASLESSLRGVPVEPLARQTGFCRRKARKLSPWDFLRAFCLMAAGTRPSLCAVAFFASWRGPSVVSRQAVWKRLGSRSADFLRRVTEALLAVKSDAHGMLHAGAFAFFRRVLIEDSTVLALAPSLAQSFPGAANQSGKPGAAVKIHAVYNLLTGRFLRFALSPFTRNDQAAAGDILSSIRKGDLLLRDLGFFALPVFRQIAQRKAFFLSRLRQQVWIGHSDGQPFDLLDHLRRHGAFDGQVLLGAQEKVPVRLVALPVSEATAAERRRRMRHNRDRRLRPTPERLALLGWVLMITNVPAEVWDAQTVCKAYRVRWRIEIVFKTWKRHFSFAALPNASARYVETILWARLLLITLACPLLDDPFGRSTLKGSSSLSLLKAAPCALFCLLHAWLQPGINPTRRIPEIFRRLCSYDKRRNRPPFPQFVELLG